MKLDQVDKSRNFTKRLLNDFSTCLFKLLQEKRLEDVTIGELCAQTNYPRSTFYNYFEDIYALMDYCWESICEQADIFNFESIEHDRKTLVVFDRIYNYMEQKRDVIGRLVKHNPAGAAMMQSLDGFIRKVIYQMVDECPFSYKFPVPYELIARHYSNTVQMILSACFLDNTITKQEANSYIEFLLGTLEKESTRK